MLETHFQVNESRCAVASDDQTSLVHFIRDELKLKGTRYGCGEEQCGACLVLIDGQPKYSCQTEVGHLDGKVVQTVEDVIKTPAGRILVDEFERFQAAQCAFCISGILVRASVIVSSEESGQDLEALKQGLSPHLCRCGAHPRILAAIESARDKVQRGI